MSNKPTIKLYTKEQIVNATNKVFIEAITFEDVNEIVRNLTPIELPTDEEKREFTIDFFNWLHNNEYKYNPKFKMYQKFMINETLFFTIEELMMEFNKTQGGGDEKQ